MSSYGRTKNVVFICSRDYGQVFKVTADERTPLACKQVLSEWQSRELRGAERAREALIGGNARVPKPRVMASDEKRKALVSRCSSTQRIAIRGRSRAAAKRAAALGNHERKNTSIEIKRKIFTKVDDPCKHLSEVADI